MKVLHIISSLNRGGAEVLLLDLIKNSSESFEHTVFFYETHQRQELLKDFQNEGISILSENIFNDWKNFDDFPRFRKTLKRIRPDVVHLHNSLGWRFCFAISAWLSGFTKIVASIHGTPKELSNFDLKVYRITEGILNFVVSRYVSISEQVTVYQTKFYGTNTNKIELIHNGIDTERLVPQRTKTQVRTELGISENELVVGTVGNLRFIKGQDLLVESVNSLLPEFPNLKLVLVGNFSEKDFVEKIQSLIENSPKPENFVLTGGRKDVADLVNIFDVYVQPSRREAFGIALAEAMFLGKPAIAFAVGGIPEILISEEVGFLAEPENSKDLAGKIREMILSKKRREIRTNGQNFVKENFTIQKIVKKYENLYIRIINS
ncbi:MAG: glycosyltransferase [Calditrichaeota bacterium]|nr:MAG: glycosyltransferase [Calditrichota bacterium]